MAAKSPKTSDLPRSLSPGYNFRVLQTALRRLTARAMQIEAGIVTAQRYNPNQRHTRIGTVFGVPRSSFQQRTSRSKLGMRGGPNPRAT